LQSSIELGPVCKGMYEHAPASLYIALMSKYGAFKERLAARFAVAFDIAAACSQPIPVQHANSLQSLQSMASKLCIKSLKNMTLHELTDARACRGSGWNMTLHGMMRADSKIKKARKREVKGRKRNEDEAGRWRSPRRCAGGEEARWEGGDPTGGKDDKGGVHGQLGQKRRGEPGRRDDGKRSRKADEPTEGRQEEAGARGAEKFCMCSGGGYPCAHRGECREADPGAVCRECGRWICMRCATDEVGARGSRHMCCSCAWRRRHEEMEERTESEEE